MIYDTIRVHIGTSEPLPLLLFRLSYVIIACILVNLDRNYVDILDSFVPPLAKQRVKYAMIEQKK